MDKIECCISIQPCCSRICPLIIIEFCISGYLQVHFLVKSPVPENHEEIITFIQRLASVGVNLENYRKAYDANDAER